MNYIFFVLCYLSKLPTIKWNVSFFYYKNVAQKIKLLTFTDTFPYWLNMEQTCCVQGWSTLQLHSTSYFSEVLYKCINFVFK